MGVQTTCNCQWLVRRELRKKREESED